MTDDVYACVHFSLSSTASETNVAGSVDLLDRIAEKLQAIEGLTDEDILNVVINQEVGIDGDIEHTATVYYSME
jgi:hypothetical protein